jgi:CheY-like chemotaxis protein
VTEASSGLRLISSLQVDRPDLVLLEAILSWMDGFDLCRALKEHPDFRDIPLVFLTARDDPGDVAEGKAAGCADYLTKPVDLDLLRATVRRLIGDVEKK